MKRQTKALRWLFASLPMVVSAGAASASPPSSAWEGAWKNQGVMSIKIVHTKHGLQASGVVDWRSGDGTDNAGKVTLAGRDHHAEFSGRLRAFGNRARFENGDCRVDFNLRGGILVVADNASCGDGNTSFSGTYRRKR